MRRQRSVVICRALIGVGPLGLAGCRAPVDGLSPITARGGAIADLFGIALALSLAIVLLVIGGLAYVMVRFRDREGPDAPEPPQIHGNLRLEVAWTIAPILLLTALFVLMLQTMRTVEAEAPADALLVRVIGRQWWWEYRYPDLGIMAANELHVPVGQTIRFQIEAADVIHSFWVPQLGWKKDGIPGTTANTIRAEFDQPGVYDGACTEYCGSQHAWMRVRLFVEPREQFDAWVRRQQAPAPPPASPTTARGQQIFLQQTCINCHAVAGTSAGAQVGPDLTHFGSRTTLGAGIWDNTPENLRRWLREAQAVKPGVLMPNYVALTDDEVAALAEYLMELK